MVTLRDIAWMAWTFVVGLVEAVIRHYRKDIYLDMDEDGFAVRIIKVDKHDE